MMRRVATMMLVTTLMMLGCASPAAPTAVPAQEPTQAPAAETDEMPVEIIVVAGGEREEGHDPTLGWGRYGNPLFQSTLLARDAELNIVHDLATDYRVSEDGLVWQVTIRDDALFSDGEPLTAHDVAYTFNTAAASPGLTDVTMLAEAVAVDDYTVELRLSEPRSTFVQRLVTLGIVPRHVHGEGYAHNPIGSGPYRLVRWDEGQQLVIEANPLYYGPQPEIERVVFMFAGEDTAYAAAQAGQAHLVRVPQALAVRPVEGMQLVAVQTVDNRGLMFPFVPDTGETTEEGHPIGNDVTADLAIRRAVNYAIDRRALVEGVLEGFGSPAYGPVTDLPWEAPETVFEDADIEQARRILAEGGWEDLSGDGVLEKDGLRAAFSLLYPAGDSTRQALALAVKDMVEPVGIRIEVEGLSWDGISERMHSDVILFGFGSHDQTEMYNLYHSAMGGVGWNNAGFYGNAIVDTHLDAALRALTEEEAIPHWRAAQWDGETGFITRGDAAWAWMVNLYHTYLVSECLDIGQPQVAPHDHGWQITSNITAWRWTCR